MEELQKHNIFDIYLNSAGHIVLKFDDKEFEISKEEAIKIKHKLPEIIFEKNQLSDTKNAYIYRMTKNPESRQKLLMRKNETC